MKKYKVFLPNGTTQTIVAQYWEINWADAANAGVLRFYMSPTPNDHRLIAIFPAGGWHGMNDVSVYEDTKKVVV